MTTFFYTNQIVGDIATLSEEETRHAVQVLRLKIGSDIAFTDGLGGKYEGVVIGLSKKECQIRITQKTLEDAPKARLHIAIAPTKNMDRLEWFVEKATEIGISSVIPILCTRSERKALRIDRLEGIVLAGVKQSLSAWKPRVEEFIPFKNFLIKYAETYPAAHKYIAHCVETDRKSLYESLQGISEKNTDVLVLIGPEGDFTADEISLAVQAGFQPVTLGEKRLRTETAGVYVCVAHSLANVSQ